MSESEYKLAQKIGWAVQIVSKNATNYVCLNMLTLFK